MSVGGHGRQTVGKGIHSPVSWIFADAAARAAFTPTVGLPYAEGQLTSDDLYKLAYQADDMSLWLLTAIGPTTWSPFGGLTVHALAGGAHSASTLAELNALISDATLHDSGTSGAVHADATPSVAGFLSATDKTKLDGIASSAAALTATAPVNVTKAAADAGVGTTAARHDHKHDVTTATAGAVQAGASAAEGAATSLARSDHAHSVAVAAPVAIGTANAAGAASTFVRSDHVHAHGAQTDGTLHAAVVAAGASGFMTGSDKTKLDNIASNAAALTATAPVDVTKAAAAVGVGTTAARHDHKHDVSTAAPGATGVATASGEGSATSLARSDHTHQSNTAPVDVTKATAAIGTSGEPARADHKHDISTATAGAVQAGASAAEGAATSLARSDHAHSVAVAAPVAIGTANSAGAASTFVRSDHVHAHGAQTDGSLHAAVVAAGASGFMTGADKTKLDAIPAGASGQVQYHNGAGGLGAEAGFEYDAAGDQLTVPGLTVTQDVLLTGVISPTSFGTSQNNYAPTGFATAAVLRLTSSAAVSITGLAGGAEGRFIILHNIGSNNITLSNSSGSSTAANQFLFSADIVLGANQSTTLRYDGTSSRWRVTAGTGSGGGSYRKVYTAYDFESPFTNYAQNAFAAVAADTANAGLLVRRFDDTALEGVGFGLTIPPTATSITIYFKSRAQSTPGGTVNVVPVLYSRTLPDNAAVGAWSGGTTLTSIAFTTNTNWQYDSQTITLGTLGLTAGNYVQFELVRNGAAGGDTLAGDWVLLELIMEFT